jgi:hypothetical protein
MTTTTDHEYEPRTAVDADGNKIAEYCGICGCERHEHPR